MDYIHSSTAKVMHQYLVTSLEGAVGTQEAGSMAYWLIEHFFGLSHTAVIMDSPIESAKTTENQLKEALTRLLKQEPIQYVLGYTEFYGMRFNVGEGVLIPRPETEELVAIIIAHHHKQQGLQILDVGTGSGCIAISLQKKLIPAVVYAMDVSTDALAIAANNATALEAEVQWIQAYVINETPNLSQLDVVVSNPPYVLESEKTLMAPNVVKYEPGLALYVQDHDPLLFYKRITIQATQWLKPGGMLYFEINERYGQAVVNCMQDAGFQEVTLKKDLSGKDRMAWGRWGRSEIG